MGERIGEGGMGEVYLAEREDQFRQRVAIKLIRPGMASPEVVRRFVIERQTLAALKHPRIVRLVDGGATGDGFPYLVVDYVEGLPIDRYCDQHKLRISERLRLFVETCDAVHHAHQSLVVHCDLKPSNILVTAEGSPMLLDFGIAKLLDPAAMGISAQMALTRQQAFTPDYASPEQLRGEPVTTTTDIYALGVLLYELLTGHSPYRAIPATMADWMRSVCEEDAEAPSTVIRRITEIPANEDTPAETLTPEKVSQCREGDPQALHRRLRGDLDAIVLKALRKDARDRYGSVDQLAADIRRHLAGLTVLARRNTTAYVARKFLRRHKLGVAAAALVLLTLAAGLASTLWESRVAARRFEDVRRLAHSFLFDVHDSIQDLPGSTPARALI
ncbi:MAG: serine/threonine-protein kinase, partial [Bryobacteraceae bacterium]